MDTREILKNKFIELGSKVTLIKGTLSDKIDKELNISNHCGNIAGSNSFNAEMKEKHGGAAHWEFGIRQSWGNKYVFYTETNYDHCYLLDGLPMGICRMTGTFRHTTNTIKTTTPIKGPLYNLLGVIRKIKITLKYETEETKLLGRAKKAMEFAIENWKKQNPDSNHTSVVGIEEKFGDLYDNLKKNGSHIKIYENVIESQIQEWVLFYKNCYTVIDDDELNQLLLNLEIESQKNNFNELKSL